MNISLLQTIARHANLDNTLIEDFQKNDESTLEFLTAFVLNFIVKNLPREKLSALIHLLTPTESVVASRQSEKILRQAQDDDGTEIFQFIEEHIPNFRETIAHALANKLADIKGKTLARSDQL